MDMKLKIVRIDEVQPNPFQPRESFEKESLKELATSMRDANVIQPIVVRPHGPKYQIIAGERRWRAAQMAGFKDVLCVVKDVPEERVLLESLIENLHRRDLADIERENAIHELWENRENLGFKAKSELARALGLSDQKVYEDLDAWEFRRRKETSRDVSTRVIRGTRGLPDKERRQIVEKVKAGEIMASEVDTAAKIVRRAPEPIKKELLKPKSRVTPKMAETIIQKLPSEEAQRLIVEEIERSRLTEDEVEDRVREIQRAKEMGKPLGKEMGVKEGTVYTVGEYECPHCKRHYLIKCDGKKDWIE